jgi:hypothetical protein
MTTTTTPTVMTDKQFALNNAIMIYLKQYERGGSRLQPFFGSVDGVSTPNVSQLKSVFKLADLFEEQLKK